jgi:hypothetical protein
MTGFLAEASLPTWFHGRRELLKHISNRRQPKDSAQVSIAMGGVWISVRQKRRAMGLRSRQSADSFRKPPSLRAVAREVGNDGAVPRGGVLRGLLVAGLLAVPLWVLLYLLLR